MKQMSLFVVAMVVVVMLTPGVAVAQEINDSSWLASYWNNETFSGEPVLQRRESTVDYNWGTDAPAPSVNPDSFSVRWQRYINLEPGTYRFTSTSDDGMRVWIDGDQIVDEWSDHPVKSVSVDTRLTGGRHLVVVEYYEDGGGAVARLTWEPVPANGDRWLGEYYNNPNLAGSPRLVRDDARINFNWGTGSPAPGRIEPDTFSVRWTGTVDVPAGLYRFTMTVDDGGQLWVNNLRLIDAWKIQSPSEYSATINLPGGPIPVRMEYFDDKLGAVAQLRWESLDRAPEPDVIQNWRGEYFDNPTLSGDPVLIRDDPAINFDWGTTSPATGLVPSDQFSVRWEQTVNLEPATYCLIMTVDDGGRLWIDGNLVLDGWKVQQAENYATTLPVAGGPTSIRMEYFENVGQAVAELQWLKADSPSLRNVKCE